MYQPADAVLSPWGGRSRQTLVAILNNPVYQENSRVMDGKIAELLNNNAQGSANVGQGLYTVKNGQVTYDPSYMT